MKIKSQKKGVNAMMIACILGIKAKEVKVVLDPTINNKPPSLSSMHTFYKEHKETGGLDNKASFMRRWNRLTNESILGQTGYRGWKDIYSCCPPSRKKEVEKRWMDSLQPAIQKARTAKDMQDLCIDVALFRYSEPMNDQGRRAREAMEADFLSKWDELTQEEMRQHQNNGDPEGMIRLMDVGSPSMREIVEGRLQQMIKMRIQPSRGVRGFFKKSSPAMQQLIIKCIAKKARAATTKSRQGSKP